MTPRAAGKNPQRFMLTTYCALPIAVAGDAFLENERRAAPAQPPRRWPILIGMDLELAFRALLREVVREAVRDALREEIGAAGTLRRFSNSVLLTRAEAANRLRLSVAQFDRLRRDAGSLRCVQIGRRVLFRSEELDALIREHTG